MSAVQERASERFIQAMGPMVNEEQKVQQVVKFITLLKGDVCPTISDEDFAKLIPAEDVFADMKQMVHGFYQKQVVA